MTSSNEIHAIQEHAFDPCGLPAVELQIYGPKNEASLKITAIINTGLDEALALPQDLVEFLGLPIIGMETATTLEGQLVAWPVAAALVAFNNQQKIVSAYVKEPYAKAAAGIGFLKAFKVALIVRGERVSFVDEQEFSFARLNHKELTGNSPSLLGA
jgi:predicted aspartyl protease